MNANVCGTQGFRSLISSRQAGGGNAKRECKKERRTIWTATSFQLIRLSVRWQKVLESQGDNQEPQTLTNAHGDGTPDIGLIASVQAVILLINSE